MTEHTTPAGDDAAELAGPGRRAGAVPDAGYADDDTATRPTAGPPTTWKPATRTTRTLCRSTRRRCRRRRSGPVWERETDRRPVLPAWVTDPATRQAAARWAWDHTVHTASFHAVRVPLYCARLAARSPRGLGRTIVAVLRVDDRRRLRRPAP